ncbi:hypothetical protein KUCAC02_005477, partial [Chaenocephalus aceratus]
GDPHSHTPPPGLPLPPPQSLIPAFVFPDESQKNGGEGRKGRQDSKSRLLGGPRGAAGSPLRSVPLRDDPKLPLSGGNLSPLLTDPLPSLQG